ncbi:MAG TPA: aspartate carbamoyltransferase catalytic subunit [Gammaproteobacteria bacterium]|nr:aspartate carbamoyltransferase catalytic subunit [Gammaproteobacteria bacterium]
MTQLHHLLTLEGLDRSALLALLDRAQEFHVRPGHASKQLDILHNRTVANLFFEPSTRTRASFELAARRLGANVINLDVALSSTVKGETLLDTLYTLQAMNVDFFVVRHRDTGVPELLAEHALPHVHIVNAGESHVAHPTQGLLDVLTIRQRKPDFKDLTVAIVGDLAHSRVARSTLQALTTLGTRDIRLAGPAAWLPDDLPGKKLTDMDQAIADADVIMMLRIQKERMEHHSMPDENDYLGRYRLDSTRLARAKPDAIVMHPGPMNRGIEITSDVADGPQSVIREQVTNGVAVRMAVMAALNESRS